MNNFTYNSSAVDASGCISQGWELIKPNYGMFFAMTLVMMVISFLIGLIPYIGGLVNTAISGAFMCGIYMAVLRQMRREPFEFGILFEGFQNFLPAASVVLLPMIPYLGLGLTAGVFAELFTPESFRHQSGGLVALIFIGILGVIVVGVFLQISMFFALQLIADKNIKFTDAVKLSMNASMANFGGIFLLIILEGLMVIGGFFALCIGFLFVMPVIYAANVVAYRQVFPDTQRRFYDAPPQPNFYGGNFGSPRF